MKISSRFIRQSRITRNRRGGAAVEFAVVLPVLTLLAIGVADYARADKTGLAVVNAAAAATEVGARSAGVSGDTAAMTSQAIADASPVTLDTVTSSRFCRCSDGSTPACTGSCSRYGVPQVFVKVRVRKNYTMLFRYPGLPATLAVIRTTTLRVQ
jgi:Flp pilus assembly protein TadG